MPTRSLSGRARCVAALALLFALLAPSTAWAQPAGVVTEDTVAGRARLVVGGTGPIAVTVDGQPQPITTTPVLSDRSAMALVVDASAAGGPGLQPGVSGLVDFALAAPTATRTALVTDTTPPAVVVPLQPGPAGVLSGLSGITPRGDRQTAAALALAAAQLPREPDSPRLVMLYTTSDSTGESADALAARLRADGIVLAVVTTTANSYWAAAAAATGGMAVEARPDGVLDAFGQVENALGTRNLVTLPAPARSAPAVVRVGSVTVDTTVPAPPEGGVDPGIIVAAVVLGVVVIALGVVVLLRRRRRWGRRVWSVPDLATPTIIRGPVLAAIEDALGAGGPVVVRPDGDRSGLGVTTALVQFAHRYHDAYDVAWWITAQDRQLIADQMAQLAEALGVAAPTDSADHATMAALKALRGRTRWLVVFDDAGSPHDLAHFLPEGSGDVIVGSTDPEWGVREVAVPPFSRAESARLLRARRDGLTTEEAEHVAKALGDVPLAVDAAGAMLAATGNSVTSYVAAVADATSKAGSTEAAWSVAFDRLAADDPPALALLTLLAWLGPEPVPQDLLTGHTGDLPPVVTGPDLSELVATLGRRGLAKVDGRGVQLHRVPAAQLVRRTTDERPDGAGWATWAVRLLRAAVPPSPDDPAGWPTWRRLMPHVLTATDPGRPLDDVAVEVGWLLRRAAAFLQARGEQESARALLEDAHDLYRRKLGRDHPETRTAARALADNLHALGRDEQAQRVLEDAQVNGASAG